MALLGLLFVISMEQWETAMQTLALVLTATLVAVVIAVPLGVLAARNDHASAVFKPIMDLMQTMPALVWLVPVVTMFSIGVVPGAVATIIFALPPGVRFTELGIRAVDAEVVEAAHAFGSTPRQTLLGVQLPLAMPTIMAGINQVIMLALSMAVIAGLVGAEGLGGQVTQALATLNLGLGFEAGLSVVILAIYLDRVTASIGQGGSGMGILRRTRGPSIEDDSITEDEQEREETAPLDLPTKIGA
jgi:ABC-type proline/glycine betaine transport system permease subunit